VVQLGQQHFVGLWVQMGCCTQSFRQPHHVHTRLVQKAQRSRVCCSTAFHHVRSVTLGSEFCCIAHIVGMKNANPFREKISSPRNKQVSRTWGNLAWWWMIWLMTSKFSQDARKMWKDMFKCDEYKGLAQNWVTRKRTFIDPMENFLLLLPALVWNV